jgi:hypothetical protein
MQMSILPFYSYVNTVRVITQGGGVRFGGESRQGWTERETQAPFLGTWPLRLAFIRWS